MVRHQKTSHERRSHSMQPHDNCTSESDYSSPRSPQDSGIPWPAQLPGGQDSHQFHDIQSSSISFDGLDMHSPYNHSHAIPAATSHAFPGQSMPQQHPSIVLHQGSMSMPGRPFFEPEQNNPGVATMNTSMMSDAEATAWGNQIRDPFHISAPCRLSTEHPRTVLAEYSA